MHGAFDEAESGQALPAGTVIAERYRIEALLGEGGMGAVYRASHVHMEKTFAVKVLHPHMTALEEAVSRFEREAIAAGRIDHANIAQATDFGRLPDGAFYLVLEYVAGRTLREVLEEEGPLAVDRALSICRQIAMALRAAHAVDVVHRDLKPDNIMLVVREEGAEQVKVLDFGIAQVRGETQKKGPVTQYGAIFGTPQYMSPEQASGKPVDARSDLYSLGLVLDEMLRGSPTFEANELMVLLSKQLTEAPPALPDRVPEPVRELVANLLQKEVDQRLQTADQLVSKIDMLLGLRATVPSVVVDSTVMARSRSTPAALGQKARAKVSELSERALHFGQQASSRLDVSLSRLAQKVPLFARILPKGQIGGFSKQSLTTVALVVAVISTLLIFGRTQPKGEAAASATSAFWAPPSEGGDETEDSEEAQGDAAPGDDKLDEKLRRLLRLARAGDVTALDALDLRDASNRSPAEWLAIAQGRLRRRQVDPALEALDRALTSKGDLVLDAALLSGLRKYANSAEHAEKILDFAAGRLGSDGADLLFNIWATTALVTPATRHAKDLLYSEPVKRNWTQALSVALALRDAKGCLEARALLERALRHADERSLKPLKDLKSETGCGASNRQDCYPCLRDDDRLDRAILQAQGTKAPRYDLGRWR